MADDITTTISDLYLPPAILRGYGLPFGVGIMARFILFIPLTGLAIVRMIKGK